MSQITDKERARLELALRRAAPSLPLDNGDPWFVPPCSVYTKPAGLNTSLLLSYTGISSQNLDRLLGVSVLSRIKAQMGLHLGTSLPFQLLAEGLIQLRLVEERTLYSQMSIADHQIKIHKVFTAKSNPLTLTFLPDLVITLVDELSSESAKYRIFDSSGSVHYNTKRSTEERVPILASRTLTTNGMHGALRTALTLPKELHHFVCLVICMLGVPMFNVFS